MKKHKINPWTLISKIIDLFKKLLVNWKIIGIYSLLLSAVSAMTGYWDYGCGENAAQFWCFTAQMSVLNRNILYLVMLICSGYLLFSFVYDFYRASFNQKIFHAADIFKLSKDKMKALGREGLLLCGLCFLAWLAVYIIMREPEPVWQIEFIYFTIAFTALMLIVLGIRLFGGFCGIIEGDVWEKVKKVFTQTENRSISVVITFFCLILCENAIYLRVTAGLNTLINSYENFILVLFGELIDAALICSFAAVMIIFARAQYELVLAAEEEQEIQA